MRTVKQDPPRKPELYIKSHKNSKFELIKLPEGLPELARKPQVTINNFLKINKTSFLFSSFIYRVLSEIL